MRLILILLISLGSSLALAVDPTLTRQWGGKCYYDDGSVLSRATCPNRLSVGNNSSTRPNGLLMSEESVQWSRNFGKQQAEALESGLSSISSGLASISAPPAPSGGIAARQQLSGNELRIRTDFADYVSKNYGHEGENLRALIMSGVIDSTNYQVFVD